MDNTNFNTQSLEGPFTLLPQELKGEVLSHLSLTDVKITKCISSDFNSAVNTAMPLEEHRKAWKNQIATANYVMALPDSFEKGRLLFRLAKLVPKCTPEAIRILSAFTEKTYASNPDKEEAQIMLIELDTTSYEFPLDYPFNFKRQYGKAAALDPTFLHPQRIENLVDGALREEPKDRMQVLTDLAKLDSQYIPKAKEAITAYRHTYYQEDDLHKIECALEVVNLDPTYIDQANKIIETCIADAKVIPAGMGEDITDVDQIVQLKIARIAPELLPDVKATIAAARENEMSAEEMVDAVLAEAALLNK